MIIRRTNLAHTYRDHDALVRQSGLDWTLARAVMLGDKAGKAPIIASYHGEPWPHRQISRESVATFLLDSLADPALIGKAPTVSQK